MSASHSGFYGGVAGSDAARGEREGTVGERDVCVVDGGVGEFVCLIFLCSIGRSVLLALLYTPYTL